MAFSIRVEAIIPKALNVKAVKQAIDAALEEEGKVLKKYFEQTTASWTGEKPNFEWRRGTTSSEAWVWCGPKGSDTAIEKWRRLDEGAEPHVITPKNAPALRFPWQGPGRSYLAKTTPGHLVSHPGGNKFGPMRSFKAVNHPGNDPRNWSIVLGEQEIGPFRDLIQEAVDRGLAV